MRSRCVSAVLMWTCLASYAFGAPREPLRGLVAQEQPAVVETLRQLVSIESGSRDKAGLDKISTLLAERLRAVGATVEFYSPPATEIYRMFDTPNDLGRVVIGRLRGTGTRKILLLGHMDTVYLPGILATRPFRIDGNRAYGPGIADDKGGLAVILHTLAVLNAMSFRDYGTLTVVFNADEELSTPGARALIQRMAGEHDYVLSCEPTLGQSDSVALATSGGASATLTIKGRASHAGVSPELGRNALVELAHQILQTNDLSDRAHGVKFNWTIGSGGNTRNVIPETATASADVRVLRMSDLDAVEKEFRLRVKKHLVPDTQVDAGFERRRPPLEPTVASRALAARAQAIYTELGEELTVDDKGTGAGTDGAFAALSGRPVLESLGLRGFGFHSSDEEYIQLDSIESRLYLLSRLVTDLSAAK